jgi:hypothetical protein
MAKIVLGDDWFIDLVNKRSQQAKGDRKSGKKFVTLKELQKEYQKGGVDARVRISLILSPPK